MGMRCVTSSYFRPSPPFVLIGVDSRLEENGSPSRRRVDCDPTIRLSGRSAIRSIRLNRVPVVGLLAPAYNGRGHWHPQDAIRTGKSWPSLLDDVAVVQHGDLFALQCWFL